MLTGGCFCGAVRFEVAGEAFHSTVCHCADCRRVAGAPMVAWFSVKLADFRITAGVPKRFRSSAQVERRFCGECGTGLTYQHADLPEELDVATCSLDAPEAMPPQDHSWTSSQLPWVKLADGLAAFETVRFDEKRLLPDAGALNNCGEAGAGGQGAEG